MFLSLQEHVLISLSPVLLEVRLLLGPGDPSRERQSGVANPVTETLDMALWLGEAGALLCCNN